MTGNAAGSGSLTHNGGTDTLHWHAEVSAAPGPAGAPDGILLATGLLRRSGQLAKDWADTLSIRSFSSRTLAQRPPWMFRQ